MISFARPDWLWLLLLVPPLGIWAARGDRRRAWAWKALEQSGRMPGDGSWAWLAGMACLIVSLGQPRWGRAQGPEAAPGHDVVLAVDVSRSMGVEDAIPNRLGAAVET